LRKKQIEAKIANLQYRCANMTLSIAARIPVAGLSTRMGDFKPLLLIDGQPMIRRTVRSVLAGGATTACVVLGREAERVRAALVDLPRLLFVENTEFACSDMLASVQLGLRTLGASGADAVFILPGDMPAVDAETLRLLSERAALSEVALLYPTINGRRGHPLLLKREALAAVLNFSDEGGVKAAVTGFAEEAVATSDEGILLDTDTPQSFANVVKYLHSKSEAAREASSYERQH
jgi:CTP:molybdopterin cytidylyltransferase MocA